MEARLSFHHDPFPPSHRYNYPHPPHHHSHQRHTPHQAKSHHRSIPSSHSAQTTTTAYHPTRPPAHSIPSFLFQRPSLVSPSSSHTLPPILRPTNKHTQPHTPRHPPSSSTHRKLPSLPRASTSSHPSTRIVSPASRASDLAIYAMTKDEKPTVDADGVPRQGSPNLYASSEGLSSPGHSLAPLASPRSNGLTIDVELSRKRKDRDDEIDSPGTPHSLASSFLMTPQFGPTEPAQKRRSSIIEHLALNEKDQVESKPSFLTSKKEEQPFAWYKGAAGNIYDFANQPIPPQQPITVFPVQYNWNPAVITQNNQASNGGTSQGSATPVSGQANNSIPLDPTLSSMRSSVGAATNGSTNNLDSSNAIAPELRFTDETLASATASPGRDGMDHVESIATAVAEAGGSGDLLDVPGDESMKKDQPFSRSPELRVSHKLAERKRRKEMKELFDELRDELPSDRGMKASKWEILSKAIDHIRQIKTNHDQMIREIEHLRREVDIARGGTGAYTHSYPTYSLSGPTYTAYNTNNNTPTQSQVPQASQQTQQPQVQVQQPQQQVQQQQQQQLQQQPAQQLQAQPQQVVQAAQPQASPAQQTDTK